jgi:dimethylargininase
MFTRAIVRPPAANFFAGLTTAGLGAPDHERALRQHQAYCDALTQCGLRLTKLEPDSRYPDSTFVEDTAVLVKALSHGRANAWVAILTRPGAPARLGEIESMREALSEFCPEFFSIESPGRVDGGDICEAADHFFIGISERTNEAGGQQLAEILKGFGYTSSYTDIRSHVEPAIRPLLHLKSGLAYLGDGRLVVTDAIAHREEFRGYEQIQVNRDEEYAANCVRINDHILVAAGYPALETKLRALGYQTIALEMSEFQKMDGGLSCLSLRF